MADTTIIQLQDDNWLQVVDASSLFYLTVVSGSAVRVAVTTINAPPTLAAGHIITTRVAKEIDRGDTGSGYIWVRAQRTTLMPKIVITAGMGTMTLQAFQVDDGTGTPEDFMVSDGAGGFELYEVIQ